MLTIEETRALGEAHPEFEPIIRAHNPMLNGWDMNTDLDAFREMMAQVQQYRTEPDPETLSYQMKDFKIPVRDCFQVDARSYSPKGDEVSDGRPGLIVFHGGGFITGDFNTEAGLCVEFTKLGGVALNIDYRHAPEHVFPQAINDAFDATVWVSRNVAKFGINPSKGLIIAGTSSGADISLAVSHLYHDANMSPPLTGVFAPITSGVNDQTVPNKYRDHFISMEQCAKAPVFSAESMKFIHSKYKPDPTSPLAFPVAFPSHAGLPKTYFQACGMDPIRDCSIILEQVYRDEGVPTRLDIYPGLPHAFWAIFPELEISQKRERDAVEGLKWLLDG
ncbi:lipase esterase [Fusarium heterosporum]|uniref:Lipase esterase n=1 Tax=Fusarium heterosporum TaxID=42747 RepID=A0A8H5SYK5_FUSHE|nr:lipase esterase [Fusarium heterosporum]